MTATEGRDAFVVLKKVRLLPPPVNDEIKEGQSYPRKYCSTVVAVQSHQPLRS
jgi:hypothetical protein